MTSRCKMIFSTLLVVAALYGTADSKVKCDTRQLPVSKIVNSLGFHLQELIGTRDNYFISPLSISMALAMLYIGARGNTRDQMFEALEYDIAGKNCIPNKISESFLELVSSLQKEGDDYSLLIANGAFIQTDFNVSHYYTYSLRKYFNSEVKYLNFTADQLGSMEAVNHWAANNTRGKIPKLLNEPLDPLTVLMLLNAVYFKGLWKLPFDEDLTTNDVFYGLNNRTKSVPFMTMQNNIMNYFDEEKNYFIIELDYMGENISMILILPEDIKELPRYDLTTELLCDLRGKFQESLVDVTIPKFKMEFQRELSKDMIDLGMGDLFTDRADLTGIRERRDLQVSLILHSSVIEVNEKGSEAAAVVAIGIDARKKAPIPREFTANHPFLFYIIHKVTNTILFSGRLVEP